MDERPRLWPDLHAGAPARLIDVGLDRASRQTRQQPLLMPLVNKRCATWSLEYKQTGGNDGGVSTSLSSVEFLSWRGGLHHLKGSSYAYTARACQRVGVEARNIHRHLSEFPFGSRTDLTRGMPL